jgi:hypothetical protein
MKAKIRSLVAAFAVASIAAMGSASAADWFVLSQGTLKSANPSAEIKSAGTASDKNIEKVKFSVEGADVDVKSIVLHWNNRHDDEVKDVGTIKAGGETAPAEAPGMKSRLEAVTVKYKILGKKKNATFKVWGYD